MSPPARLRHFAARHTLWQADTGLVAAVSGGSDSVALLLLLHELHVRGELRLLAVAHLNHRIRADADADEAFCRALAARLQLPFASLQLDIPALARRARRSLEVTARIERRRFLVSVARSMRADAIATGHTQDDQAETVLLRLIRGAGRRGLGAMAPRRERFVRPLLWASREELRGELRRRGQDWREDSTNADRANPRNRVRHELLPYLAQRFNPAIRQTLARAAAIARDDDQLLARLAAAAAVDVLRLDGEAARLDRETLVALPAAVARRVVLHALSSIRPQTAGALQHVEAVMDVALGRVEAAEVPQLRVEHSGRSVVLVRRDDLGRATTSFQADLSIPGEVRWANAGLVVQAEGPFAGRHHSVAGNSATVTVAADGLEGPLIVRSRRPGDRLRPLGLGGRKKLQDLLVDRKVSRDSRDKVPVVTDKQGRIVWVAGHAVSEDFRVTDRTNAVLILKLRRISNAKIRP